MAEKNYFGGMREAEVYVRPPRLVKDGVFLLEIEKTFVKDTEQKGDAFIVEFKILESNKAENPVGSRTGWYQGLSFKKIAWAQIKLFMYAVLGFDYGDAKDRATIEQSIDPEIENLAKSAIQNNDMAKKRLRCFTSGSGKMTATQANKASTEIINYRFAKV